MPTLTDIRMKLIEERQPTPRELEVLELVCRGHSSKQIAEVLGLSHKTVSTHRMRLMAKAQVHDSISLFRWALEKGHIRLGACPAVDRFAPPLPS